MSNMKLYGAPYSVYTRIVRLVLHRLDITHEFIEVDIFADEGPPAFYRKLHPFKRIPALEHNGTRLFETDAIVRYLTHLTPRTTLMPEEAATLARGVQIMRVLDNYGFRALVWGIYVEEHENDEVDAPTPEAIEEARKVLQVLDGLMTGPYFVADSICLPDFWALPMLTYLNTVPTGARLLLEVPALATWLAAMQDCPSVSATAFPGETNEKAS